MDSVTVATSHSNQAVINPSLLQDYTNSNEIYFWLPFPHQATDAIESCTSVVSYEELYLMRVQQMVGIITQPLVQQFDAIVTAFSPFDIQESLVSVANSVLSALLKAGLYQDKTQINGIKLKCAQGLQAQVAVQLRLH